MHPYRTIRLNDSPDVADIKAEGRASHVGRISNKSGEYKSYTRNPARRRAVRRYLKRKDKSRAVRFEARYDDC